MSWKSIILVAGILIFALVATAVVVLETYDYNRFKPMIAGAVKKATGRELVIDGLVQGGIDAENRLSVYEYAYLLQFLPVALNPGGKRCLVIGVGAGLVPRWYEERGVATDVVAAALSWSTHETCSRMLAISKK